MNKLKSGDYATVYHAGTNGHYRARIEHHMTELDVINEARGANEEPLRAREEKSFETGKTKPLPYDGVANKEQYEAETAHAELAPGLEEWCMNMVFMTLDNQKEGE